MAASLFGIIKKYAKTGNIDLDDIIQAAISVAGNLDQANRYDYNGKLKRNNFSKATREIILIKQAYCCNICKKVLDEINFDHIDGTRSNNSIANCQALCPNCHAKKTRKKNTILKIKYT